MEAVSAIMTALSAVEKARELKKVIDGSSKVEQGVEVVEAAHHRQATEMIIEGVHRLEAGQAEILPMLRTLVAAIDQLVEAERFEPQPQVRSAEMGRELDREWRKCRSELREHVVAISMARQVDSGAGSRAARSVWWKLTTELDDHELEALVALKDGPVTYATRDKAFHRGAHTNSAIPPVEAAIEMSAAEVSALHASLVMTASRHGRVYAGGAWSGTWATALLQMMERDQREIYELTPTGTEFLVYLDGAGSELAGRGLDSHERD